MTPARPTETTPVVQHSTYDQVPYESHAFSQSHPDHLAVLARLFGMQPAPVERCRVLELGSASGGNIIPLACALPDSRFMGLDLSKRQIDHGRGEIEALGLGNIELRHLDLMDVDRSLGTFDYIIVHGVYSWVPDPVKDKILEVCDMLLAPQGVAFISYNTYPGWHYHGMVRDMMLYHTAELVDPAARATQARALLDFLSKSIPTEGNAYGIMLKTEVERLRHTHDSYLLHEHLEEVNQPVYFYQFMQQAARHGVQYLGESDFSSMLTANFPAHIAEALKPLAHDLVRTEQYMDFLRNRAFRQTLLCRKEVPLRRNLTHTDVFPLQVASAVVPVEGREDQFTVPRGGTINVTDKPTQAAFRYLGGIWPRSVPFDEVLAACGKGASRELLGANLLNSFTFNAVTFRTWSPPMETRVTERPHASDVSRHLARTQERVTSLLHESLQMDVLGRTIVTLLDGTRTVPELVASLMAQVSAGSLSVQKDGKPLTGAAEVLPILQAQVLEILPKLARGALLVG